MTHKISHICSGLVIAAAFFGAPATATAQIDDLPPVSVAPNALTSTGTSVTPAATVAMIFYKLSGKAPDYQKWAMQTEAWQKASPLEKDVQLEAETANFRNMFTLTTLAEPVIIQRTVTLSPYSYRNGGFSVAEFNEDAYFDYSFGGDNYAVVIPSLPNYQWIDVVSEEKAAMLDRAADKNGRKVVATLFITPDFADASRPMQLGGKDYWLISGQINRIVLSAPGSSIPLWEKSSAASDPNGKPQQEILDLYRK